MPRTEAEGYFYGRILKRPKIAIIWETQKLNVLFFDQYIFQKLLIFLKKYFIFLVLKKAIFASKSQNFKKLYKISPKIQTIL